MGCGWMLFIIFMSWTFLPWWAALIITFVVLSEG
jgi:hypothetical protein